MESGETGTVFEQDQVLINKGIDMDEVKGILRTRHTSAGMSLEKDDSGQMYLSQNGELVAIFSAGIGKSIVLLEVDGILRRSQELSCSIDE